MKKFISLVFLVALLPLAACQKEIESLQTTPEDLSEAVDDFGNPILNPVLLQFNGVPSKVSLTGEGTEGYHAALWDEGDMIKICCLDANDKAKYVSCTVDAGTGKFSAVVEDAATYYAVYPATLVVNLQKIGEDEALGLQAQHQRAVGTSFKDAAWYAAKTTSAELDFAFKPISTILKCTVENPAATKLLFRSLNAGFTALSTINKTTYFPISFDGADVSIAAPASNKAGYVTFTGLTGAGTYYLALPAIGEVADEDSDGLDGVLLKINGEGSGIPAAHWSNTLALTPGKMYTFSTSVDDKIIWDYYVSTDGEGTGLSSESPATLSKLKEEGGPVAFSKAKKMTAMMRDGINIHMSGNFNWSSNDKKIILSSVNSTSRTLNFIGAPDGTGEVYLSNKTVSLLPPSNVTVNIQNLGFVFKGNCEATLENIRFHDFNSYSKQANAIKIIDSSGSTPNVSLENCIFENNVSAAGVPSAIWVNSLASDKVLKVVNCKFINNHDTAGSAKAGAAVNISSSVNGNVYFTHCLFAGNSTNCSDVNASAINAANNGNADAFLGINNCLFIVNGGNSIYTCDLRAGCPHLIMNSSLISPHESDSDAVRALICSGANEYGKSLLLNNVIYNARNYNNKKEDNKWRLALYPNNCYLRCGGYNLFNLCEGDYLTTADHDVTDLVLSETNVWNVTGTYWDPDTYAWTWYPSAPLYDALVSQADLDDLITGDTYNDAASAVQADATAFLTWLKSVTIGNGNAFTTDLYGNVRNASTYLPGCYQPAE